jgi:hypothetical protein
MTEQVQDVQLEPVQPIADNLEEALASQEETQEQVAPETAEIPEPEQQVPYSRFKDVIEEKNYLKQQNAQMLDQMQQRQPVQPQQQVDKYAHLEPAEQVFYRNQEKMMREVAKEVAEKQFQTINPVINSGLQEIAVMKAQNFRVAHPEIKKGSQDETDITQRVNIGYSLEDAYWSVMGPRGVERAQTRAVKQVKQNIQQKRQANTESPGVAPPVIGQKTQSLEDSFNSLADLADQGKL